ncbi:unnamed protein product, partial [Prorocentrum cordatum]
ELRLLSSSWTAGVDGPNGWQVDLTKATGVPGVVLGAILAGRCRDQCLVVTPERQRRFCESLLSQCSSLWFAFDDCGVGAECARAIGAALLLSDRFTSLSLATNALGDKGAAAIAEMLAEHTSLVHLDVSANGISWAGAGPLLEALLVNRSLTHLDISSKSHGSRNRVERRNAAALERMLATNPVLAKLCLSSVCLGTDGLVGVARGLTMNSTLLSLDLSGNDIGTRGALLLCDALASCGLEELNLSDNRIGDEGLQGIGDKLGALPRTPQAALESGAWDRSAEAASGAVSKYCEAVGELPRALRQGSRQRVADATEAALAGARAAQVRVPKLRFLALANNGGSGAGVERIGEALRTNPALERLVLDGCEHRTVEPLMASLPVNASLRSLSLGDCRLSSAWIVDLCSVLPFSRSLESLSLRANHVGPEAAAAIGAALATDGLVLRTLNLSSCHLRDPEGATIARGLAGNVRLENLNLRNNALQEPAALEILDAVRSNTTLTQLTLELNAIDFRHIGQVKKLLERNLQLRRQARPEQYSKRLGELLECKREVDLLSGTLERNHAMKRRVQIKQAAALQTLEDAREHEARRQRELELALADVLSSRELVDKELAAVSDQLAALTADNQYEASQHRASIEATRGQIGQAQKHLRQTRARLEAFEETAGAELALLGEELRRAERGRDSSASMASAAQRHLESFTTSLRAIEGDLAGGADPRQRRVAAPTPVEPAAPRSAPRPPRAAAGPSPSQTPEVVTRPARRKASRRDPFTTRGGLASSRTG